FPCERPVWERDPRDWAVLVCGEVFAEREVDFARDPRSKSALLLDEVRPEEDLADVLRLRELALRPVAEPDLRLFEFALVLLLELALPPLFETAARLDLPV